MADAGILVFVATNQDDQWQDYGFDVREEPIVMFALRPKLGEITTGFVRSGAEDGASSLVWYRWLVPPRVSDLVRHIKLESPLGKYRPGRSALLGLDIGSEARGGLSWVIDEHGVFIDGTRVLADNYVRNRASLIDPDEFRLVAQPPVAP
jgi:hypothetical protein